MKAVLDPDTLARAVELTVSLQQMWPDPSQAVPGLALAIAASAPELSSRDLLVLGKLGIWICAFDDYVENPRTDADEVEERIACYEALVCRNDARGLGEDKSAGLLIDVLDALRVAPLGASLWPLFATQLATSLEATRWEIGARDLETYVAHATESSFISVVTTAAAMLIGEPRVTAHIPSLLTAQRHAAAVLRLANQLSTGHRDPQRVQQMMSERLNVAGSLTKLAAAPATAAFILRFTDFFVALHDETGSDEAHGVALIQRRR
ncbi:MAG TPA: terpene synthase family protein [Kofleriaceae bacterium]